MTKKSKALLALILLVPAPSIGNYAATTLFPNTLIGNILFLFSKIWLFTFPAIWMVFANKEKPGLSKAKNGGFIPAAISGLAISAIIVTFYILWARFHIDRLMVQEQIVAMGLGTAPRFIAVCVYWIIVNSILEEYAWRWFVVSESKKLMGTTSAILLSATCFTFHHIVAMLPLFNWKITVIASSGIFVGGAIWSWLFAKYQSIWPAYLSHAIVDLCIFVIAYLIIFT